MSVVRGWWLWVPPVDVALSAVTPWSLHPTWCRLVSLQRPALEVGESGKQRTHKTP